MNDSPDFTVAVGTHTRVCEPGFGLSLIRLTRDASRLTLCIEREPHETAAGLLRRVEGILAAYKATPLKQFIFGGIDPVSRIAEPAVAAAVARYDHPVVWINGDGNADASVSGTQVIAIIDPGAAVRSVRTNAGALLLSYSDEHARHTHLGALPNPYHACPRESQTTAAFATFDTLLHACGTDFGAVARTWIYMDRLLDWYGPFNTARTTFFRERELFGKNIPSSTGIGAINAGGAAISLSAYAVEPISPDPAVSARAVPSPLQCPANDYKSSFSRAHLIEHPHYRELLVSGTASIEPGGASVNLGDVDAQIELTMRVIEAIFTANGFAWADANRAIAYFKPGVPKDRLDAWFKRHGVAPFPVSVVCADVCRDELLFELEIDAMLALNGSPAQRAG